MVIDPMERRYPPGESCGEASASTSLYTVRQRMVDEIQFPSIPISGKPVAMRQRVHGVVTNINRTTIQAFAAAADRLFTTIHPAAASPVCRADALHAEPHGASI